MPRFDAIQVGDELPEREHTPTEVQLFLFNAAVWNPHRIHFDRDYATRTEGYPGVVIDGPLQADWLAQTVMEWIGNDARLASFKYSNRRASYVGETLYSGGRVAAKDPSTGEVTLELRVSNEAGETVTPATAVLRFHAAQAAGGRNARAEPCPGRRAGPS